MKHIGIRVEEGHRGHLRRDCRPIVEMQECAGQDLSGQVMTQFGAVTLALGDGVIEEYRLTEDGGHGLTLWIGGEMIEVTLNDTTQVCIVPDVV